MTIPKLQGFGARFGDFSIADSWVVSGIARGAAAGVCRRISRDGDVRHSWFGGDERASGRSRLYWGRDAEEHDEQQLREQLFAGIRSGRGYSGRFRARWSCALATNHPSRETMSASIVLGTHRLRRVGESA